MLPDPERTSKRLLEKMGVTDAPIDVSSVQKVWKLSIVEEDIDGPGYLLPLGGIGGEIIVRHADPIERKRFTIAHEVGHWVLGITCEHKTGAFRQPRGVRNEIIEKWCDTFAASLLIPRDRLVEYFDGLNDTLLVAQLANAPRYFMVSEEAMFFRAYEVFGMRIAYFDRTPARITRTFVPESVVSEVESVLSSAEIRDWLYLDSATLILRRGSSSFTCSWSGIGHPKRNLLLVAPNPLSAHVQGKN